VLLEEEKHKGKSWGKMQEKKKASGTKRVNHIDISGRKKKGLERKARPSGGKIAQPRKENWGGETHKGLLGNQKRRVKMLNNKKQAGK